MERWPLAAPDQPADRRRRDRCKAGDDGLSDGVQLAVRHGVRLVPDEDQQEIERLRREMDLDSLPSHQAGAKVDDNRIRVPQGLADYTRGSRLESCRSDALSRLPARRP